MTAVSFSSSVQHFLCFLYFIARFETSRHFHNSSCILLEPLLRSNRLRVIRLLINDDSHKWFQLSIIFHFINHFSHQCYTYMLFLLHGEPHIAPFRANTTPIVLKRILISSAKLQLVIYSVSSFTTCSKSVISDLPLTCHIPVIPGLHARRAR